MYMPRRYSLGDFPVTQLTYRSWTPLERLGFSNTRLLKQLPKDIRALVEGYLSQRNCMTCKKSLSTPDHKHWLKADDQWLCVSISAAEYDCSPTVELKARLDKLKKQCGYCFMRPRAIDYRRLVHLRR